MLNSLSTIFILAFFTSFARSEISSALFSNEKEEVYKNSFFDEQCNKFANEKPSKCVSDPETMDKICKKTCMDKEPYFKTREYDDDGEFFNLNAKKWNGSNLDFDRFIGFITAIIFIPISYENGEADKLAHDFDRLVKITPKESIEFLVFPVKKENSIETKFREFVEAFAANYKTSSNVHVMENASVTDGSGVHHPVYQYVKEIAGIEEVKSDVSTFVFVNPQSSRMDVLEGKTFAKVKRYSFENLQSWEL